MHLLYVLFQDLRLVLFEAAHSNRPIYTIDITAKYITGSVEFTHVLDLLGIEVIEVNGKVLEESIRKSHFTVIKWSFLHFQHDTYYIFKASFQLIDTDFIIRI